MSRPPILTVRLKRVSALAHDLHRELSRAPYDLTPGPQVIANAIAREADLILKALKPRAASRRRD